MEIKKFILHINNTKNRFEEKKIGEEEKEKISNFFIIKKNGMKNPKKLPYIELLKPINQFRNGSIQEYHKVIYFNEIDLQIAKEKIINDFQSIYINRSKESLSNLLYINEENIKFVNDLIIQKKNKIKEDKA